MSIATELSRIQSDRNTIRNKLIELGLAVSTDNLDKLAAIIEDIINRGAVSVTVKEGETYTIPAGYHNGSGTVSGVSGGGNYSLQSKTATPTKKQQNITPDSGYYGLSDVTVAPIPEAFQDVSSVTAAAGDILTGKVYVTSDGTVTAGTMANNGAVSKTLSATVIEYVIPKGYHNGEGKVTITLEEKTVTPTKAAQEITPTSGNVLSKVTVNPIPDQYQDVTPVTAGATDVLTGKKIVDATGAVVNGTMANRGSVNHTLRRNGNTNNKSYTIPAGYHNGSGTVSVISDYKTVTPSKQKQVVLGSSVTEGFGINAVHMYNFLDGVTVEAIPDNFIDTSDADALPGFILEGSTAYVDGVKVEGTMPNNATDNKLLTVTDPTFTIPAGYHDGSGDVFIQPESKTTTPTKEQQTITPSDGKVISEVVVEPIPAAFQNVTGVTAASNTVLAGSVFVDSEGNEVEGAIETYGANYTVDGLTTTSVTLPEGFHSGSTVSLTADIEEALAAI